MPQMMCDFCKSRPARARVTQVENGDLQRFYACRECAVNLGYGAIKINMAGHAPEHEAAAPVEVSADERATCPGCGMTYPEFRESAKFGCARCYSAFQNPLALLMRQIQAGTQHIGKVPTRIAEAQQFDDRIMSMRAQLQEAVRQEDFARAARLRDAVHEVEGQRDDAIDHLNPRDSKEEQG